MSGAVVPANQGAGNRTAPREPGTDILTVGLVSYSQTLFSFESTSGNQVQRRRKRIKPGVQRPGLDPRA